MTSVYGIAHAIAPMWLLPFPSTFWLVYSFVAFFCILCFWVCFWEFWVYFNFPSGFTIENELSRKCFTSKSISIYLHFRFLTFLLCDFLISLFVLLQFLFSISIFFFCWSSKKSWDRAGGILVFKVTFFYSCFSFFPCRLTTFIQLS